MSRQSIHIENDENVVNITVSFTALIGEEKPGMYASYCPALDLYSQGETLEEAEKNIIEATALFIESCIEDNTLGQILEDCGFSLRGPHSASRKPRSRNTELPFELATAKKITIPGEFPMTAPV